MSRSRCRTARGSPRGSGCREDAEAQPVPAILEYIPYRKNDKTLERDHARAPWLAAQGYAYVRVDLRGTGESEGRDGGRIHARRAAGRLRRHRLARGAAWCDGGVGIVGISWGGFNGLQIAALRPPALKAVVTICSTDDRYADDIHYMGGTLLCDQLSWASVMFGINTLPPDPAHVGERWRADVGGAARRLRPLAREMAAPPDPRRVLEARLDLRELRGHRGAGLRGQRLGRRLLPRRLPPGREPARARQRASSAPGRTSTRISANPVLPSTG